MLDRLLYLTDCWYVAYMYAEPGILHKSRETIIAQCTNGEKSREIWQKDNTGDSDTQLHTSTTPWESIGIHSPRKTVQQQNNQNTLNTDYSDTIFFFIRIPWVCWFKCYINWLACNLPQYTVEMWQIYVIISLSQICANTSYLSLYCFCHKKEKCT